jgi:hypothetical protein
MPAATERVSLPDGRAACLTADAEVHAMIEFELAPALVGSGSVLTGDRTAATRIGVVVHHLVFGTLEFGWVR